MKKSEDGGNPKKTPRNPRVRAGLTVLVVALAAVALWKGPGLWRLLNERAAYAGKTPTFVGDSNSLERTVIVPTLDTPRPRGKNVIWCSSFQLAWNEIRDNVIGAPLQVLGAEEVARRLNEAQQSVADLEPDSYYAKGGWIEDGIIDTIEKEMAARFPSHELPDFNDCNDPAGILAYSYLVANVPFKYPFRQLDDGLTFADSQGTETQVGGFGLWEGFMSQYKEMREQIEVLYLRSEDPNYPWPAKEYALDLCRHSRPYQVVVAMVEPKDSLGETLAYIEHGITEFERWAYYKWVRFLREGQELRVPEMFWRIDHRYTDLIGKVVANMGMPIVEARQAIEFRLDRSGAMLESEALIAMSAAGENFLFDRPFLVYMKKRGADQPFFVMWVDNAELLTRQP
ncbi:MAG: hypothetical protein JW993_13770 [Sedimentisphaerales bacterium]|nr:hypothetical protein [Sedimentisphaerales bacterium]